LSETITCAILNIEDFQAHEEKGKEKKDNETESEETESEAAVENEELLEDRILDFVRHLHYVAEHNHRLY
jgi:hypothetical protein